MRKALTAIGLGVAAIGVPAGAAFADRVVIEIDDPNDPNCVLRLVETSSGQYVFESVCGPILS